jgi:D-beta-D-heptose 7-phosphate kinase/D-beta-D-heptose 1-phosphate adenosyltransferase
MSSRTALNLLASFPGKRVLVLGDVMLDEFIWGDVRRISPEAPVPVVAVKRRTYVPGGASNTAANVAAFGGRPMLLGVIGKDSAADQLRAVLAKNGIDSDGLVADGQRVTTTKARIVAHNQQVVRLDSEQREPLSPGQEDEVIRQAETRMEDADACIISDYAKGVVSSRVARQFIRLARQAGRPVIVDPKGSDYTKYRGATIIKPNVHEAETCTKQEITDEPSLLDVGRRLIEILEGSSVLITRGGEGMSLIRDGSRVVHVPALCRNVFDVTGAGDTVAGALAMGLAAKGALEEVIEIANLAASVVVGKVGTATVTLDELVAEARQHFSSAVMQES